MDIEYFYKVAGLLGATIAWLHQVRTKSRRDKIKLDLEILEKTRDLLGRESRTALLVEKSIERRGDVIYGDRSEGGSGTAVSWSDLSVFFICLLGAYGFASEGGDAKIWQLVVAGVLAFIGVGALLNAIEHRRRARSP